ncbi:MAG TPA: YceD family protein [Salinisphaeraceae bacterium]|nr:YceD family protein [Salinisphaeraceae bacterium]
MPNADLSSRAMGKPDSVPNHIDYRRCAIQGQAVAGTLSLASLPRVVAAAHAKPPADAVAQVQLDFREDGQRRVQVDGWVTAPLMLQCQRCMETFRQIVDTQVSGIIVASDDAAAAVPREFEPIMAAGHLLDVHALVADELLLALPMVARCQRPACRARYEAEADDLTPQAATRKDKPFAVLSELWHDKSSD